MLRYPPGEAPVIAYGVYKRDGECAGYLRWPYATDGRHFTGPIQQCVDAMSDARDEAQLRAEQCDPPCTWGLADELIQRAQEASGWDPQPWAGLLLL